METSHLSRKESRDKAITIRVQNPEVEPIKVMKMGGWKDIKTMMIYARKAGVGIAGIADCLNYGL